MTNHKQIHEAILLVENFDGSFSHNRGYGGRNIDTPLVMASITKLFTTTCIFILRERECLSLNDKVTKYFDRNLLQGLHIYKGQDYSMNLTVSDLLLQTSGLPDFFEEGTNKAKKRGIEKDLDINFDEKIKLTKKLKPHFSPTSKKRAHYTDLNFDMLGEIIEKVANKTLEEAYKQFIFEPLGIKQTYLPTSDHDFIPNVYYKHLSMYRPKFIKSCRASGSCISTARELMRFIKAFFGGELFNQAVFQELDVINRLQTSMYPIHYGAGFMRIPLGGFNTLFMGKGELIGHSGSTGSFAFYDSLKDLFFVGDVNQMANHALPIRMVIRLSISIK